MANIAGCPGDSGYGFDRGRSLLVVSTKSKSQIYLVAGAGLDVGIDDESVASFTEGGRSGGSTGLTAWEKSQDIRILNIKGNKAGSTTLNALLDGRPWIQPLAIRVVDNADRRQSGNKGTITPELRRELQELTLREAVVRVAQDQMNSAIGQSPKGGDGRYDTSGTMWCGSFIYWCYAQASLAKGVKNPFEGIDALRSGIKALGWGMKNTSAAVVLQYEGPDRYGGLKTKQPLIELGPPNELKPGDIALPRENKGLTFPHVCMVLDPPDGGTSFTTIDGNMNGAFLPTGGTASYCIGVNAHDASVKTTIEGKSAYKWVFVHLRGI